MKSRTEVAPIDYEGKSNRVAAMCHVGNVRLENQDYMRVFEKTDRLLFVVSDGMGGHHGGFEASRLAINEIGRYFERSEGISPKIFLAQAIDAAHHALRALSKEKPEMEGMGATVVVALIESGQAWIAHVGDSRAHLLRGSELRQLTIDHTAINALAYAGDLNPEQLDNHPYGHILEQSLGGEHDITIEIREQPLVLQAKDRLILSTDGYWQTTSDADLIRDLSKNNLIQAAHSALEHALDCGGSDNITIGIVESQTGEASPLPVDARDLFLAVARREYQSRRPTTMPMPRLEKPPQTRRNPLLLVVVVLFFVSILFMI